MMTSWQRNRDAPFYSNRYPGVSALHMGIHVVRTTAAGHLNNGDVSWSELQSDVLNEAHHMLKVLLQCGNHLHCLAVQLHPLQDMDRGSFYSRSLVSAYGLDQTFPWFKNKVMA